MRTPNDCAVDMMITPKIKMAAATIKVRRRPNRSEKYCEPNAPKTVDKGKISASQKTNNLLRQKSSIAKTKQIDKKDTSRTGPKIDTTDKQFALGGGEVKI